MSTMPEPGDTSTDQFPPPSYSETQTNTNGAVAYNGPPQGQIFIRIPPPQPRPIVQRDPKECCCGFSKKCCIITWSICGVFTLLAIIGLGVLIYFVLTSIAGYDCKCDLRDGCTRGESPSNDVRAGKCGKVGQSCDFCSSVDDNITECFEKQNFAFKCINDICYCAFLECKGYMKCGHLCCTGKNNTQG